MFLRDEEFAANREWFGQMVVPTDPYDKDSPIQASSIDLSIGRIYLPETASSEHGGIDNPWDEYQLPAGATAIVETSEVLKLPADVGAFGFPPARVSSKGLLMTNPGHVDPGYWGTLRFTVINMGRQGFDLKRNDPIVTLLAFRLQQASKADWRSRRDPKVPVEGVNASTLVRLSKEFLDVTARAEKIVRNAEVQSKRIGLWAPITTAIVSLIVALIAFFKPESGLDKKVSTVETKVDKVENRLEQTDLDARLKRVEEMLQAPGQ